MAEEALVAEIRLGYQRFQADMRAAQQTAERQSREIARALGSIDSSIRDLPQSFNRLNTELRQSQQQMQSASQATGRFSGAMQTLRGTLAAIGIYQGIAQIRQFTAEMLRGGEAVLNLEAQMRVATGSIQGATQAMAFAAAEANRLSQDTIAAQTSFTQITTAARDTAIAGRGTEIIFQGMGDALTAAGRGGDDFQRIMNQVTQGLNIGKVRLEDLIVLAENNIPAQKLLAEAIGVTGDEFAKAMSEGKVSAEAFILLGQRLTELYGDIAEEAANRLPGAFRKGLNEVKDEFRDLFAAIFESQELVKTLGPLLTGADIFPPREEIRKAVDNFAKHLAVIIDIGAIIFRELKKVALFEFSEIARGFVDIGKLYTSLPRLLANTKIPIPPIIREVATAIDQATQEAIKYIDALQKKISETPAYEIAVDLGDEKKSLSALKRIRAALNETYSADGLDAIDPDVVGPMANKSATAVEKELETVAKARDKVLKGISAPSKGEIEQAAKEALAEEKKWAEMVIDIYKRRYEAEERMAEENLRKREALAKQRIQVLADALKKEEDLARKRAELELQEQFQAIKDRVAPAVSESEKIAEAHKKVVDNMRENIQDALGDVFTDVFRGQLDSIQDFADSAVDIIARMIAEMAVALTIQPMLEDFFASIEKQLKDITVVAPSTPGGQDGVSLGQAIGGVAAGAAVGAGVSSVVGGGIAGSVLGGAAAGAVAGAVFGPWGAAIGGVIGALAGLTAAILDAEEKIRLAPLTSPGPPTSNVEQGVVRRGPFGFISLVDQSSNTSPADANTVATIIAEADAAISRLLSQRQRDIVSAALQGQHYALDARAMDDAIAQALQTRLYIMLASLTDAETAVGIVGDPYTGTAENIQVLQQRAAEALSILKTIEEFRIGDLGEVALQISRVQDQFADIISRAQSLGLDEEAAELEARRDQEIGRITTDFNTNIRDQILGFTDPALQAAEELQRIQEKIWQDAVAAGADLAQVQELFALQWEDHARRWGTAGEAGAQQIEALTLSIENFSRGGMSGTMQQILALNDRFLILQAEAIRLGIGLEELTKTYEAQHNAIIIAAQQNLQAVTLAIVDPFGAAMLQISIDVANFQQLVNEGFIDQGAVDAYERAAREQAVYNEAIRIGTGATIGAAASWQSLVGDFVGAGAPLSAVESSIQAVSTQAYNLSQALIFLASTGAITTDELNAALASIEQSKASQIAAIQAEEAERQRREREQQEEQARREREQREAQARQERERRQAEAKQERERRQAEAKQRREERKAAIQAIDQFTRAGLSGPGGQIASLRDRFEELRAEAQRLNVSTKGLTASFKQQVNEIKRDAKLALTGAIQGLIDPFGAALAAIHEQAREFRRMEAEGLVKRSEVNRWQRLAVRDAQFTEASRIASGGSTPETQYRETIQEFVQAGRPMSDLGQQMRDLHKNTFALMQGMAMLGISVKSVVASLTQQHLAILREAEMQVWSVINSFGSPFQGALIEAEREMQQLQSLVADKLLPQFIVDYANRLIKADVLVQETLRQISGGPVNSLEQLANSFDQFIKAGDPLSSSAQDLYNLTEKFVNLADAAHLLGYSTAELEQSYLAQSQVIREKLIEDIENQLSAQIEAIESIDEYLSSLRMAEEQPLNIRLDEAQAQFQAAMGGSDVSEMISAAETLRDIARQQYGASADFFAIESQITTALGDIRSREQAIVDAERQRMTEQAERELRGLQIGQSSLDQLQRVAHFGSESARALDELAALARQSAQREQATYALMERVLIESRR